MIAPILSLLQYTTLVADLPAPTEAQMRAFADYVSHSHSWYKHLPLLPPGRPFQVFLDPSAGMQRVINAAGLVRVEARKERGFHYSWIPTRDYRERFGYLAYSRSAGSTAAAVGRDRKTLIVSSDDQPTVHDPRSGRLVHLPSEVLTAGRSWLSGLAHTGGTRPQIWRIHLRGRQEIEWPEESGGRATLQEILERCRQLEEDPSQFVPVRPEPSGPRYSVGVDATLYQIVAGERTRQLRGLIQAMERVVRLVGKSAG